MYVFQTHYNFACCMQLLPQTAHSACLPNSASLPGKPSFAPSPLVAGLPATFNFGTFPGTSGLASHPNDIRNGLLCYGGCAESNTSVRISRAQLAVSKPAPFAFSLPLDLCFLSQGLCGTALRGPRPQPNPAPFLLPSFAPQVLPHPIHPPTQPHPTSMHPAPLGPHTTLSHSHATTH